MSSPRATDDTRDLLREVAAILIGLGAAMWVFRTGAAAGAFASFCILAVASGPLLWMSLSRFPTSRSTTPWQGVVSTVGILLALLALRQLANWFGEPGDASNGINIFWAFGLSACLCVWSVRRSGIRFQLLLACLLAAVSFAGFLDAVLSDGIAENFGLFRGLMLALAIVIAGVGVSVLRSRGVGNRSVESATADQRDDRVLRQASEVFTGATVIAVFACGYGISSALGLIPTIAGVDSAGSGVVWEVPLLLVGVASVASGAAIGSRGLTWAGAVGLILFFYIIGLDIHSGERRRDSFGVWPALLLALGILFLGVSLVPESSLKGSFEGLTNRLRSGGRKR